ncbi:phage tail assembly chaperone [Pseudomonas rhodesiae]|uniref:phage tail assembly chaperone n=1 Tax=Pseudomonas rhodesiae TaxID=76760 RepID=UPI001617382B
MSSAEAYIRTVEHDGVTYRFAMPSAEKQRAILFRLGKYGVEPMIRGLALAEIGASSSVAVAGGIVGSMLARMPEDDFNFICDSLLGKLFKEGSSTPLTLEDFSGRLKSYFTIVVLALGVTFEDFSGLLTLFQKSTASAEAQDSSQENESTPLSTGNSGDPV